MVDKKGQIGNTSATGKVENIDTTKPTASITNKTSNSVTFTASDEAGTNEKASGITHYSLTTTGSYDWQPYTGGSKTVENLTQGQKYYLYVKDSAGNISESVLTQTNEVADSNGNINSYVAGWQGATATVEFTTDTDYYIQTKVGSSDWSENSSEPGFASTTATTGETVYARLTDSTGQTSGTYASVTPKLKYVINYDGNGEDSGTMIQSIKVYGEDLELRSNKFSKTGYTFKGWSTTADGSVSYTTNLSEDLSSTYGDVITLYAVWEINKYTISYDANGGSGAPSAQTKRLNFEYDCTNKIRLCI